MKNGSIKFFTMFTLIFVAACSTNVLEEQFKDYPADASSVTEVDGTPVSLIFEENFDADTIDTDKWNVPTKDSERRGGLWSPDSLSLDQENNFLRLKTFYDEEKKAYMSGELETKQSFQYGYFTARFRISSKNFGHWFAIWLYMNVDEIDLLEYPYIGSKFQQTLHWKYRKEEYIGDESKAGHYQNMFTVNTENFQNVWHTVSVLWTSDKIVFYFNGVETFRFTGDTSYYITDGSSPLIISDEINDGTWPTAGIISKNYLPDYFDIDFVRIYSLK
jgi:beta-glucanase (GH16 family)